jgi:hypothetical protein
MNLVQRAQLPPLGGRRINPLATIATRTVPWFTFPRARASTCDGDGPDS